MSKTVTIIGAGLGGLSLAIALGNSPFNIVILEQSDSFHPIGAGIQISPNVMPVFQALGLRDKIIDHGSEVKRAFFRDYKSGEAKLSLPLGALCQNHYTHPYLNMHRADLHDILHAKVNEQHIPIHMGAALRRIETTDKAYKLGTDKGTFHTDIIIGADGIHSRVRQAVFNSPPARFTGQCAWRALVPIDGLKAHIFEQNVNNWMGPGAHIVTYPVKQGSLLNIVAVTENAKWQEESWARPDTPDNLRTAFKDWEPTPQTLLERVETCYLWGLFEHAALPHYHKDRIALMGDAAHAMLPFMAQGAAMAIEDAYALAQCLMAMPDDPAAGLAAYDAQRRPRTQAVQKRSTKNAALYHATRFGARHWRDIKFGLGSRFPNLAMNALHPTYGHDVTQEIYKAPSA